MTLIGPNLQLIPLAEADRDELFRAVSPPEVWRLMPTPIGNRDVFESYIDDALKAEQAGTQIPFAVKTRDGLIGSTRFARNEPQNRSCEIGFTWYHPTYWRTYVNTECKILMLDHAFDDMLYNRVYFRVDTRNERSQRAVERTGGFREGVLRNEMVLPDGYVRSTVIFSILREEWPAHRARLANVRT